MHLCHSAVSNLFVSGINHALKWQPLSVGFPSIFTDGPFTVHNLKDRVSLDREFLHKTRKKLQHESHSYSR